MKTKMKLLKGSPLFNFSGLLILLINIFFFSRVDIDDFSKACIGFFIINLFIYLLTYNMFHYFEYDEEKLVVRNSWNFLTHHEIKISELTDIFFHIGYGGRYIVVKFNGRKKAFGINNVSKNNLNEMVDDIKRIIDMKKNDESNSNR